MQTVIKVENLSKQYRLGTFGTGTLRSDLQRFWANLTGKEDPTLKIGQENTLNNSRNLKTENDYIWALNEINFEVKEGEVLGIIGKNGAGKSTLLKILSQVTTPSIGKVKVKGRIASLLEVGTGFHPELTGRENIFLNGAILGMNKNETRRKFDEILDFAGIDKYIDTPVKRYSSGMYVRLAFAVAAHLDPEILIVDEVLAVGDAEFQNKCLGKMKDVSTNEGRTVLFVSHNMGSISVLCAKTICLNKGSILFKGPTFQALKIYNENSMGDNYQNQIFYQRNVSLKKSFISDFEVKHFENDISKLIFIFKIVATEFINSAELAFGINNEIGSRLLTCHSRFVKQTFNLVKGENNVNCTIENFYLKPGTYNMNIFLGNRYETLDFIDPSVYFRIPDFEFYSSKLLPDDSQGCLMVTQKWESN